MTTPTPSPRGVSEHASWRRTVQAALTDRLGLKATAFMIAVLLWLIVSARQPTQAYVDVRVSPTLDSSLALLDPPTRLQALVAGRSVDIVKLLVDPPVVYRKIDGDAPDTLRLDVAPGDVRVPPELADDVRILDVQPRQLVLRFGTRATRHVPVVSNGRILERSATKIQVPDSVQYDPATVRITGPRRLVRRLGSVHPYSLTVARGDTTPHVADLDTSGLGVQVLPARVNVIVRSVMARPFVP